MARKAGRTKPDHPRVCGEKPLPDPERIFQVGSPPRMRGKELECRCVRLPERITPAYAGKSHKVRLQAAGRWDHPRVCGEKCAWPPGCGSLTGSPPRMRGKDPGTFRTVSVSRITPAYAGKSAVLKQLQHSHMDHPRVCGEKRRAACFAISAAGSPPRMRGKGCLSGRPLLTAGITPAYAGKSNVA